MPKYLIDVNLPCFFSLWQSKDYVFQRDIDPFLPDSMIWKYAEENNLTIVTKDSDFSTRILLHKPPPRVIHIRFGNLNMSEFYNLISNNWDRICELSQSYKLVNVFKDRIEGIE